MRANPSLNRSPNSRPRGSAGILSLPRGRLLGPVSSNVDMASLCQEAVTNPLQLQIYESRCRTGNATEPVVATRNGCATVVHADMRGLVTSRQIYVAGLPSL